MMNGNSYSSSRDSGRHGSHRDHPSQRDDRGGERDRRRSRSPGHRSSRHSRRDGDIDSYSLSRDYREREREDRYSGRDRRGGGDREWDRDRGSSRRDSRRDDDDRPLRRDNRDLFDDRRGGGGVGGGGGGGRRAPRQDRGDDGFAAQQGRDRKKSASPPPKKKEPTPDLTDVVSVLERKRRLTQWDIKPPGYENVTSEQAKLSGMFPLPGAPRQQPMDPSRLQAFMAQPNGSVTSAALKPSNSRQAKRLLIHNIPPSTTEEEIINFFNLQLNGLNVIEGSDPCISAQISKDRSFALIEFKQSTDATMALAMDGINMEDDRGIKMEEEPRIKMEDGTRIKIEDERIYRESNGVNKGLIIRRPKDYIVPTVTDETTNESGVISNVVIDTQNKISISNIPPYLTDEQVTELLVSFGELKAFVLVKDSSTEESRGIAFCEYSDPQATDIAVEGLNGMELGEKHLKVQRASIGHTQVSGLEMSVNAMSMLAGTTSSGFEEGRVLQLLNMVTPEELIDNQDYEEICEDVKEECEKYGKVLDMKVPRPTGGSRQSNGVGKIFVRFDTPGSAGKALRSLAGRKFADRTVVTTFFSEENYEVSAW
ncbi:Splicing factor U2AF subunit [Erysiphe necator]|uniref:Putative splicing factor u2af 50 kDa subunit n=1 Tax=Uncinula necator TaxID=52586 RepID=A0A0B1PGF1_UNCNE|nr:Splicing factor U2AF subunit [Erysiphe necator]KHJ35951.1 putative splicing factor u2af 50 kda subunit [Erysiphe necator]